jgi:glycosyltransferase involved in cell wall biosynthesis
VLLVTHYFPEHGGGIELVADEIAQRLPAHGIDVEWVASREAASGPTRVRHALPVPAWNVAERLLGVPYPLWSPGAVLTLSAAMKRCDVVHLHDTLYMGNLVAFAIARLTRRPTVVTQHIGVVPYRSRILRLLMTAADHRLARPVLARADAIAFVSRTTERHFQAVTSLAGRSCWIANGVDTNLFHPVSDATRQALRIRRGWPPDIPVLLFVGRFVEKKGIDIIRTLARTMPQTRWIVAGWGPEDPSTWKSMNVTSVGRQARTELPELYQAADLLVLPSVGEGFPLVVQESMACGTPAVISSETAGAYPGLDGMVWSTEPSAAAFGPLLGRVLASPATLRARRSEVASFASREWNWERCAEQYAALIRRVAADAAGSPRSNRGRPAAQRDRPQPAD